MRVALALPLALMALAGVAGLATVTAAPAGVSIEGRRIYHGLAASGQSCASCHGLSGEGGAEGGTLIPAIDGLIGPGRAYRDPAALCRALAQGKGAGGRAFARSMPRYTLGPAQCGSLWSYLAGRGSMLPAGIDDRQITVRITPAPTTPSQVRWRDILAGRFAAINRAGGLYGRQLVIADGAGPAAFLVAFAPVGPLSPNTALRIALREPGDDPAARGIESAADGEAAALLRHMATLGVRRVRWIDPLRLGPSPADLTLVAGADALEIVEDDACRTPQALAVVILSPGEPLSPACAAVPLLFAGLRTVPLAALPPLLSARRDGTTLTVFAGLPFDATANIAPALVAGIIAETSRLMTASPTEQKMLAAFDRSWRGAAQDRRTLYAGVGLQEVAWPSLTASGDPMWEPAPD